MKHNDNSSKKILFISHDASRTGAPLVLLTLLQHICACKIFQFDILLLEGGPLEDEFRTLGSIIRLKSDKSSLLQWAYSKIINKDSKSCKSLSSIAQSHYSVIYANTIVSAEIADKLKYLYPATRVIFHVHELEYTINAMIGHQNFEKFLQSADCVLSASEAVRNNIITNYRYNPDKIITIYPFSNKTDISKLKFSDIKTKLHISPTDFVIGAAGQAQWRKGYDIFIALAHRFATKYPSLPCHFIWVGNINDHDLQQIKYDLQKCKIESKVHFIGETNEPESFFNAFDVMAMVSREDPFPLVCLEAGSLSKPIICFEGAGGISELVEQDCGYVIPYLNIEDFCNQIHFLYTNPDLKYRLGKNAALLIQNNFSPTKSIFSIIETINNMQST